MPLLSSLLRLPKSLGVLLISSSVLAIGTPANAMTIEGWKYDPDKGQVEMEIADGVKPRHFLMAQPARIVVDLQDTQMGNAPPQMTYTSGPVQRITVEQLQPQLTRVTLFMFPSTVFAKGQVAIDRIGDGNRGMSDVWTLRPLLKGMESKTSAIPPVVTPIVDLATPPPVEDMPPGMAAAIQPSGPVSIVKPVVKASPLPIKLETVKPEAVKPEAVKPEAMKPAPPSVSTLFPPMVEPITNAPVSVSIPIAVPTFTTPPIQTPTIQIPQPIAKADTADTIVLPDVLPDSLPTLAPAALPPSTVSVPPLSTIPSVPAPTMMPVSSPTAQPMVLPKMSPSNPFPLPDRLPQPVSQPVQSVSPQLAPQSSFPLPDRIPTVLPINQSAPQQPSIFPAAGIAQPVDRNPIASNPATVQPNVISFGQPLVTSMPPSNGVPPLQSSFSVSQTGAIVLQSSSDGRVGLPAGTVLMVRYTGISPIAVKGESRKEILTLQSAIRDRNGAVLAPEGTTIYGAFVGKENRFVAESIVLQGQTLSLVAESPNLGGSRNPSERSLLQNSGLGLLAGVLIGGLSGGNAVGGAAAGAIVSYATAPKSATIQPGQTLELKLTQDWIIPFGASVSRAVGG